MVSASPQRATPIESTMTHPFTNSSKYKEFKSVNQLAKTLIKNTPDVDWGCQFVALAQRIGELNKRRVTWWLTRPEQTQAFADFLELPVEDLGVQERAASFVVNFSDFPALKPLDLKREVPWRLGHEMLNTDQKKSEYGRETLEEWLEPNPASWRPPSGLAWLHIGSSIEQQLLTQKLLAVGRFDVLVVPTLADAEEELRGGKPLIVSVSASSGEADFYAMAERPDSAGLLVIAPFAFPIERETTLAASFYGWERIRLRGRDRRKFELSHSNMFGGDVKRWTWTLAPDWRVKLLDWVGARLDKNHPDTHFSAEEAQKWLNRFDPQSAWFSTPSDLLQLCQIMHSVPYTKLPRPSDKDGGLKLAKMLFKAGPAYRHIQMAQLAGNRWESRDTAWSGCLPMDTWLSLSPDTLVAVSPAALKEIASGKNLAGVKNEIKRLAQSAELGNPDALLGSGLIRADSGGYDFQRTTLAALLVRDKLLHQVSHEAVGSWGWACFDPERRPLVDAVLDAISIEQLLAASQRLVAELIAEDAVASAAIVGASEALFIAVSRRIADRESIESAGFLPLAQAIVKRLDMASAVWALPEPLSRPIETDDDKLRWITACWAWSLLPNTNLPTDSWLFPGWCRTLPEVALWIGDLWYSDRYETASPAWIGFLSVVDEWLKDVAEPLVAAPRSLHIGMLSRAAAGQWKSDLSWWECLSECFGAQDALLERLTAHGGREAPQVALRLWPSWVAFERNIAAENFSILIISKVRRWLLESMNAAEAIDALKDDDLWHLVGLPGTLPPNFRPLLFKRFTPLLLAAFEENSEVIKYGKEIEFFERFGEDIAPLLSNFLTHQRLGSAAAECLWRWADHSAVQLLQTPEPLAVTAYQHLLMTCPSKHLGVALETLQAHPELLDSSDWTFWSRQHLPDSGKNAPALLLVLKAAESTHR